MKFGGTAYPVNGKILFIDTLRRLGGKIKVMLRQSGKEPSEKPKSFDVVKGGIMTDNVQDLVLKAWGMMDEKERLRFWRAGMFVLNTKGDPFDEPSYLVSLITDKYIFTDHEGFHSIPFSAAVPFPCAAVYWAFEEMLGEDLLLIMFNYDGRDTFWQYYLRGRKAYPFEYTDRPTALMIAVVKYLKGRGR